MPLFETADVVRGPGANAPSIVDSVGGSFVLHAPERWKRTRLRLRLATIRTADTFRNESDISAGKTFGDGGVWFQQ